MSYSIEWEGDDVPDQMVDLGGGMVVPLRELYESALEAEAMSDVPEMVGGGDG